LLYLPKSTIEQRLTNLFGYRIYSLAQFYKYAKIIRPRYLVSTDGHFIVVCETDLERLKPGKLSIKQVYSYISEIKRQQSISMMIRLIIKN
jgi:hypothetical protein